MYVLCLHADKAKGLQINLSEALQGKIKYYKAYSSYKLTLHYVVPCYVLKTFPYSLTHSPQSSESKRIEAIYFPGMLGNQLPSIDFVVKYTAKRP